MMMIMCMYELIAFYDERLVKCTCMKTATKNLHMYTCQTLQSWCNVIVCI